MQYRLIVCVCRGINSVALGRNLDCTKAGKDV